MASGAVSNFFNGVKEVVPSLGDMSSLLDNADRGRVVFITLLTSLFTIMPVGYHMVILNVPEKVIQNSINESLQDVFGVTVDRGAMSIIWSIIVSCQALGALLGCLLVLPISQRYGVKTGMMLVNNCILVCGAVIMSSSYWFHFAPFLIVGRILTGVYTGIACALLPSYVQQVAPKNIKGSLSCFMHIAVCFGSSLGAILSLEFMLGGEKTWGILLLIPAIFGLVQIAANYVVPNTPNHLLQQGHYSSAIKSIKFYYDIEHADDDESIKDYWDLVPEVPEQDSFWFSVKDPATRWGIILGVVVSAAQVFSGSMATISYSSSMFTMVSFMDVLVPFLPALGSIISIIMTIPALQMVESTGRRELLIKTMSLCIFADCLLLIFSLISSNQEDSWASWGFAVAFFLYGIGYNLGTGPLAYFIPAELVPPQAATASLGAAVATNWFCSLITTLTYYPLSVSIGGWSYLLFIFPSCICLLIIWRWLPETKFFYKDDSLEIRLLNDLGPSNAYGTFGDFDEPDLF